MNPHRQSALAYLRAPSGGFWHWAEDGSVLVWRDGSTITFREEAGQIIEWLAPNGLPPFGAVVFLLAACRGKVAAVEDLIHEAPPLQSKTPASEISRLSAGRLQLKAQLAAALAELGKVAQLPSELKNNPKARCILAEAVFEPARAERHTVAREVLGGWEGPFTDSDLEETDAGGGSSNYIRQIHIVAEGLKHHSAESLTLRLRTGLDVLPKPANVDLATAEQARKLIEELGRDREFGAVARAARELMAAVRLPRRLGEREQLAIGGVSDITNRGPLDRLLLSELAHDDLTLSVRVALNEALYLRREPPVREPPGTLALLLDSGVRLWGVPRLLATAVALALLARDKQHSTVLAWRAHGSRLQPVDLFSRDGLIQHLSTLETDAQPGEALPAFVESLTAGAQSQSVLITHRDTLADPEFRRQLGRHPDAPGFIAAVDGDGHFELHVLPLTGRPPLCQADLDLNHILADQKTIPPLKLGVDPSLPAIFGLQPLPFLLPLIAPVDNWAKDNAGNNLVITQSYQLAKFQTPEKGVRFLSYDSPAGKTIWMECLNEMVYLVKDSRNNRPARLCSQSINGGSLRTVDLVSGEDILAVHRYGETLMVIRAHDVRAYALNDGRLLGRAVNPHTWIHGRFFRGQKQFYFAGWNGTVVRFQPVNLPHRFTPSVIAGIFDREGFEDPWLIHKDGTLFNLTGSEQGKLPMPTHASFGINAIRVSRDGQRILASVADDWVRLKDLPTGIVTQIPPHAFKAVNLNPAPPLPGWNLYRATEMISVLPAGLAICGRSQRWRRLSLTDRKIVIVDITPEEQAHLSEKITLGRPVKQDSHGCFLRTAEWPNGSRVMFDTHGMLHLKSGDSQAPEVSLVLSAQEVAGWTSDGKVCGPSFFFEGEYVSEPAFVFNALERFLDHL
jgi:hypothetical protein